MLFLGYFCSVSFDFLVFGFFEHGVDRSVSSKLVLNYFFLPKNRYFPYLHGRRRSETGKSVQHGGPVRAGRLKCFFRKLT